MTGCRHLAAGVALAALAAVSACGGDHGQSRPAVDYELVSVGDPGNASDSTGFGSVPYAYRIGKLDVTIGQYTAFLNAVAASDTHALYSPSMATDLNSAGISRAGSAGSYTYDAMDNEGSSANRPITYVSWLDAARFANWMSNGQPRGAQDASTTENGAYDLSGSSGIAAVARNAVNPNTGAAPTFFIPLENEWYKAAYFDPTLSGGAGGYHLYATRSSTGPGNVIGDGANQANSVAAGLLCVTQSPNYSTTQNYLTDVGAFSDSASFYGTFDQSGNVWEWNDLDGAPSASRGLRGGYWFAAAIPMQSVLYSSDTVTREDNGAGFRLASPAAP
ncbi:formylglycine-generating enzyme family protein [Candidatus Binatia bacterium]|nr:formylglycine-generating enzyme family protein [Candidatus Binatia bacterium]